MLARIGAWLVIACACACTTGSAHLAGTFRVVPSTERLADLSREIDGGTLVSRDLFVAPEIDDLQVSPDGAYYSYVRDGDAPARLFVGRLGQAAHPHPELGRVTWIGEHTLLFGRNGAWYRGDPADPAFSRITSTLLLRAVEDGPPRQGIASISSDRHRVIFNVADPRSGAAGKLSPWSYDVATGALTRVLDNTRYSEIIVDEAGRPAFALDRGDRSSAGALALYERTPRGWVERTVDLPPNTAEVLGYQGGTLALRTGTDDAPTMVLWDPATGRARPWFPPGATDAVVARDLRTILLWRDTQRWHALDTRFAALADALTRLGIDQVANASSTVWTASAPDGVHRVHYIVDLASGELREVGPRRDGARAPAIAGEVASIPSLSGGPPEEVTVFRAQAQPRGVVLWASTPLSSATWRAQLAQLLTSRGYHLVTGTDDDDFDMARGAHAAWAVRRFGALPIACVHLRICDFEAEWRYGGDVERPADLPARPAAIIRHPFGLHESTWEAPEDASAPVVPELRLGAGYTRAASFEEYEREQVHARSPAYVALRDRAPVAGIALRGEPASYGEHQRLEFALVEGFLAQHLGGRMEPMPLDELRTSGVRVIYGLDKLTFLEGRADLTLAPLDGAQRAELARGLAAFGEAIHALPIKPPCDEVPARIRGLTPPAVVVEHRYTDEVQVLLNKLTSELSDAALAAGCTTGMITGAAREVIRRGGPAGRRSGGAR